MDIKKTHERVFQLVSYFVVGLATILLLVVCFMLLDPIKVIDIKQQPIPTVPPQVISGQIVTLQLDYCKYHDLTSHITINFVGDAVIPSLSTERRFPTGCHKAELPITIPLSTPTGSYYVRLNIDYQTNILQHKHYEFDSAVIKVTNKTQGLQGIQGVQGVQGVQGIPGQPE